MDINSTGRIAKRTLDLAVASGGLVVLSPVLAVVSILILAFMGRPVLFRQTRPGYNGKPFELLKFRTMREACNADGTLLPDAERLTMLGRFLRRTSIDEFPQLWNVARGHMSLVGPRPLLLEYLELYTPEQWHRHDVKPGITGLAQISGRNAISWQERLELDIWYAQNWSLMLDVRILVGTFGKVLTGQGITGSGVATMTKFRGQERDEL
jgi:lipopolysaccharide/colanic/teichoic acid biosynthesis glycosyltransferase